MKPFDLQAALSGKAVILRDGRKAFVRHHETKLDASKSHKLLGYLADGDYFAWCEDGVYLAGVTTTTGDIIGMWPETRIINGFEVQAPETQEPEYKSDYYVAATANIDFYSEQSWTQHDVDKRWLERGLVFLNKEDAIANAKAMLGIDPHSKAES